MHRVAGRPVDLLRVTARVRAVTYKLKRPSQVSGQRGRQARSSSYETAFHHYPTYRRVGSPALTPALSPERAGCMRSGRRPETAHRSRRPIAPRHARCVGSRSASTRQATDRSRRKWNSSRSSHQGLTIMQLLRRRAPARWSHTTGSPRRNTGRIRPDEMPASRTGGRRRFCSREFAPAYLHLIAQRTLYPSRQVCRKHWLTRQPVQATAVSFTVITYLWHGPGGSNG